jgi:Tfp pilus assembly protein PilO
MNKTLIIPICIISSIALGMGVISPKYNDYKLKLSEVEAKNIEVENLKSYYKELDEISNQLEKYSGEMSKIDLALPSEIFAPVLFDFFRNKAAESGLILDVPNSITSSPSKIDPVLQEHSATLFVTGSYSSIKNFLEVLENSARFFEVENISLGSDNKDSVFSANLTVKFYSY